MLDLDMVGVVVGVVVVVTDEEGRLGAGEVAIAGEEADCH
jgi:hypothetical protein